MTKKLFALSPSPYCNVKYSKSKLLKIIVHSRILKLLKMIGLNTFSEVETNNSLFKDKLIKYLCVKKESFLCNHFLLPSLNDVEMNDLNR